MDLIEKTNVKNRHPWEISRANILQNIIECYPAQDGHWLDVGAGDQYIYERFKTLGFFYLVDKEFTQLSQSQDFMMLRDLGGVNFDLVRGVLLLDVLEHVPDDQIFFSKLFDQAHPGTLFYITVPAYQFLFSRHDEFLKHFRRYNIKSIKQILNQPKLKILQCHHFFFSLFLIRLLQKILGASEANEISSWKFSDKHPVTRLICGILVFDYKLCQWLSKLWIRIPGLSILAVVKKVG